MGTQSIPPSSLRTVLNTVPNDLIGAIPALLPYGQEIRAITRPYRSIEVDLCRGREANGNLAFATVLIDTNVLAIDSLGCFTRAVTDHLTEAI